tara:strand:+ start:9812 stop:10918 length:1107 start_codon:yes stop_codon:yes gene_type:complete
MSKTTLFNSDITKEEFLKNYWNKRPYLFKNAFTHTEDLASPHDLLELAIDESCETRLVYKDKSSKRKLIHGPFSEQELHGYMKKSFALIAHNLNNLSPEFYEFQKAVSFIPGWEFDDVMSVYSNDEMSLGAHIDNYNVFIFQGLGKRRWEIQQAPNKEWREDEELKVLKEFDPDFEWILGPGDMIYVPPGVAHHGTSLTESISYSIGFKSLETSDVLGSYFSELDDAGFFSNDSFNVNTSSDVPDSVFAFFRDQARILIEDEELFNQWLLKKLSTPKYPIEPSGDPLPETFEGVAIEKDVNLKYAAGPVTGEIAINKTLYKLTREQLELLMPVLDSNPFNAITLSEKHDSMLKVVLEQLWMEGAIFEV